MAAAASEPIRSSRLELVPLGPGLIEALLERTAARRSGLLLPEDWPDEHDERFLRLRRGQMLRDPSLARWVRAVVLAGSGGVVVGHAGFHGPPGVNGRSVADALEVGYTIFPAFRRRGYATEAAAALIAWSRQTHGVRRFYASVTPGNVPSLAVVGRLGFAASGEQWDDEDGLELVFELTVD